MPERGAHRRAPVRLLHLGPSGTGQDLKRSFRRSAFSGPLWLCILFFISGFPALLYQIVWQRALFAIYGVNIESVTVVVSAFMLGLGLGSLAGGRISERADLPLLLVFGCVELSIAAFGM